MAIYAIGDIHGSINALKTIFQHDLIKLFFMEIRLIRDLIVRVFLIGKLKKVKHSTSSLFLVIMR